MADTQQSTIPALVQQLRYWGWPGFFATLPRNFLLVCDKDLLREIVKVSGQLKCQTIAPEQAWKAPARRDAHSIVVFTCQREWALTCHLRRENPNRRVISAQYQLAAKCIDLPARLPEQGQRPASKLQRPLILLSSPYSDAEYLSALMKANGLPFPREYLAKPFLNLIDYDESFMPLKLMRFAADYQDNPGPFAIHLQMDLLQALEQKSILSFQKLRRLIQLSQAKVIHVRQENRLFHAANMALMEKRPVRSIWTMPPIRKKTFPGNFRVGFMDAYNNIDRLADSEAALAAFASSLPDVHTVSMREVVDTPMLAIASVSAFLGQLATTPFQELDYHQEYADLAPLERRLKNFRHELVDRIGLHAPSLIPG